MLEFHRLLLLFGEVIGHRSFVDVGRISIFSKNMFSKMEDKYIFYCRCYEIEMQISYAGTG